MCGVRHRTLVDTIDKQVHLFDGRLTNQSFVDQHPGVVHLITNKHLLGQWFSSPGLAIPSAGSQLRRS